MQVLLFLQVKMIGGTFSDKIDKRVQAVSADLRRDLREFAVLEYVELNSEHVVFLNTRGDHAYRVTTVEGRRLLGSIRISFESLTQLMDVVCGRHGTDIVVPYHESKAQIEAILKQEWTWAKSPMEDAKRADDAFRKFRSVLQDLPDDSDGIPLLIPDTNALLSDETLTEWRFPDFDKFCILLTPTVLGELDHLKVAHRNETVREKARSLINQVKEFRRRGSLLNGVELVKDISRIRTLAVEPDLKSTLPWLDAKVADDRLLASIIEVIRCHPRSTVVAVSRDINFQNKAEYAGVPYIERASVPVESRTGHDIKKAHSI